MGAYDTDIGANYAFETISAIDALNITLNGNITYVTMSEAERGSAYGAEIGTFCTLRTVRAYGTCMDTYGTIKRDRRLMNPEPQAPSAASTEMAPTEL